MNLLFHTCQDTGKVMNTSSMAVHREVESVLPIQVFLTSLLNCTMINNALKFVTAGNVFSKLPEKFEALQKRVHELN